MTAPQPPEFSRPISVSRLGSEAARFRIEASEAEAAALAHRFGIPAIQALAAEVTLQRRPGGDIGFAATLVARATQICVVSLEPFEVAFEEPFTLVFRAGIDEDEADRLALEDLNDEIIEPLVDDTIDIGEVIAQQLAVALDPYPRAPGIAAAGHEEATEDAGDGAESPFAVLRRPPET